MQCRSQDFPWGGGVDSRGGYVSKILYVKTKESGPLRGVGQARPLNPPMQWRKEGGRGGGEDGMPHLKQVKVKVNIVRSFETMDQ